MKLGIVGFGRRMSGLSRHFRERVDGFEICGIVDQDPASAQEGLPENLRSSTPFYPSLEELCKEGKPDALAIGTRCDSHAALSIEAAPYGLPLFLEKPVATNMADAMALEEAFRRHSCPTLVSFPLRASALCRRAKECLTDDAVGPVEHVMATNYVSYGDVYFRTWFRDFSVTQGLFLQKATHDFDYLSYLVGAPVVRVAAMMSRGRIYRDSSERQADHLSDAYYYDDIGTPEKGMNEDSSSALLEFASGARGVYTQVFYSKRVPRRGAAISGLRGMLEFDWYQNKVQVTRHQKAIADISTVEGDECHFGGDVELVENFIGLVRGNAESLAPIETGLASVYACLAAKQSAETGQFVSVRQLRS